MIYKDLKAKFKTQWPDLRQIWLRNDTYIIPSLKEMESVVKQYVSDLPIIKGFNECENFALFLHAEVKKHGVKSGLKHNWAFGDFICKKQSMFQGVVIHSACICLCEEGFYIIEPMENNRILKANEDYKPFFINLM